MFLRLFGLGKVATPDCFLCGSHSYHWYLLLIIPANLSRCQPDRAPPYLTYELLQDELFHPECSTIRLFDVTGGCTSFIIIVLYIVKIPFRIVVRYKIILICIMWLPFFSPHYHANPRTAGVSCSTALESMLNGLCSSPLSYTSSLCMRVCTFVGMLWMRSTGHLLSLEVYVLFYRRLSLQEFSGSCVHHCRPNIAFHPRIVPSWRWHPFYVLVRIICCSVRLLIFGFCYPRFFHSVWHVLATIGLLHLVKCRPREVDREYKILSSTL